MIVNILNEVLDNENSILWIKEHSVRWDFDWGYYVTTLLFFLKQRNIVTFCRVNYFCLTTFLLHDSLMCSCFQELANSWYHLFNYSYFSIFFLLFRFLMLKLLLDFRNRMAYDIISDCQHGFRNRNTEFSSCLQSSWRNRLRNRNTSGMCTLQLLYTPLIIKLYLAKEHASFINISLLIYEYFPKCNLFHM